MNPIRPAALSAVTACLIGVSCSTVSGLDELLFDLRDAGGVGGATTGSQGGFAGEGAAGGGGEGGGCPVCDDPPDDCAEPLGTCEGGSCTYAPKPEGSGCDDADACTVGDACDGAGTCVPGETCPNDDPCKTSACVQGACELTDQPDGTSCGMVPALRCCTGACVDISTDVKHCGGCSTACKAGLACEPVDQTPMCDPHPADTSGRCACAGANADCPLGQICRTVTPYTNRCTPESTGNCDGTFVDIQLCPNFCSY